MLRFHFIDLFIFLIRDLGLQNSEVTVKGQYTDSGSTVELNKQGSERTGERIGVGGEGRGEHSSLQVRGLCEVKKEG